MNSAIPNPCRGGCDSSQRGSNARARSCVVSPAPTQVMRTVALAPSRASWTVSGVPKLRARSSSAQMARSFGATRVQILTRVYVPSMMPILLETLRISMIFNFTGVMIAEMYASRTGIGHLISNWGENFQLPQLFAGVILLAAVAIAFNETVRYLEHRVSAWRT